MLVRTDDQIREHFKIGCFQKEILNHDYVAAMISQSERVSIARQREGGWL